MKIGIKSEIHDCTIAIAEFLEKEKIIKSGTSKMLEKDKELRIDNQYYLKNMPVSISFEELSDFMISIKDSLSKLDNNKISELREKISKI